jgi:hypothetical protein
MEHYVGLDVSLKLTAICIVDRTGKIEREGSSDPETIAIFIKSHAPHVARVEMSEAMKKDVQEAFEKALAGFEKRQEAEHQRFREREKFETEWARIRTVVVVPALEEIKALLSKAGWQCEARADKDHTSRFIGQT